ncbi:MAG: hypothetical protein KDC67_06055 [Ignavibacteriae bacterium]|nr:hypothetical protein [Ignavibacteriota bacterium]
MPKQSILRSKTRKEALKHGFRSGEELKVARLLKEMSIKYEYETLKLSYEVKPSGKRGAYCNECGSKDILEKKDYITDFYLPDYKLVLEVKGNFSEADQKKMVAVKEKNMTSNIIMVFQNPNLRVKRGNKIMYSEWCDKKEIEWTSTEKLKSFLTQRIGLKKKQKYHNLNGKNKL